MADEQEQQEQMTDEEIATLANKEIQKRDEEIAKLTKQLNMAKLYSKAPEEEEATLSRDDALKILSDSRTSNYDYAVSVLAIVDDAKANGEANPLGRDGDEVYDFLKNVIDECDGDKSRFCSIYQARLGADDPSVAMAYNKRKR